jgi:hypothetical protein
MDRDRMMALTGTLKLLLVNKKICASCRFVKLMGKSFFLIVATVFAPVASNRKCV